MADYTVIRTVKLANHFLTNLIVYPEPVQLELWIVVAEVFRFVKPFFPEMKLC